MSPSTPTLRRFVIVAAPRTGSNWLCTLLDSHPEILCHHEIFNPEGIHLAWSRRDGSLDLGSVAARDRDPEAVLARVWSTDLGHARVGFKMTRGQAGGVLATVLADSTVQKVVLRRDDSLATFVSEALARQTGEWESYPGIDIGRRRPRIEVDPVELAAHRRTNEEFYDAIDRRLEASGQAAIRTRYERLGEVAEQRRLLAALGVDPEPALRGVTRKQTPTDLSQVVTNYDSVAGLGAVATPPLPRSRPQAPQTQAARSEMSPRRPFVHLNFAVDARGRMGSESGGSLPISTDEDWRRVHGLREQYEAVAVGGRTWIADRPRLTVRAEQLGRLPRRQPDRVVFAGGHACEVEPDPRRTFLIGRLAPQVPGLVFSYCADHDLDPPLEVLHRQGVRSLLVEGGPTLLRSFLRQRCYDRLTLFVRTDEARRALEVARQAIPELPEMLGSSEHGGILLERRARIDSNGHNGSRPDHDHDHDHTVGELLRTSHARMPTRLGEFEAWVYEGFDGAHHVALVLGDPRGEPVLTRVHSECLTGDVLGSLRCDCGPQLDLAIRAIAEHGRGVVVYLRQEGRGIGLLEKIRAYALQDTGLDTVEANEHLGHPADGRTYAVAAQILADLGVSAVRLLTNNPAKMRALEGHGLRVVERCPAWVAPNLENEAYLRTKREKLGHWLDDDGVPEADGNGDRGASSNR